MPYSSGELGRAGTHGGLHSTSAARPRRKEIGLDDLDLVAKPEPLDVRARAGQRARILVGRDHAREAAPGEDRGEHAGAGADVEGHARGGGGRGQRRRRDEVHVLAAHRREDAVVRMDAAAGRGDLDALAPPFVRADEAQQLAQRHDGRFVRGSVGLAARLLQVGRPAQADAVVRIELDEQHAERARALRTRLPVEVERGGHRGRAERHVDAARRACFGFDGHVDTGSTAPRFGLRAGRSARLASALSICRAFWKSPRHRSAVPWQARP